MSAPASVLVPAPVDEERFRRLPAEQQPQWPDQARLRAVVASLPDEGLVGADETRRLRADLVRVLADGGFVLQLGDCVEDIDLDVYADTRRKLDFVEAAGDRLETATGCPVLTVGRIAGQHAKPRSNAHELVDGIPLPVYRGPIVNRPGRTADARRPDPENLVRAHRAARAAHTAIDDHAAARERRAVWTSHELLLLDYELRYLRPEGEGSHLATTHWPWIGARTRQPQGAHVAVAASLTNPVSVKIGPDSSPDDAVRLSQLLNPDDQPGRLAFIARLGRAHVDRLAEIARAVRRRGRTVHWITDPMHGNTVTTAHGVKTRHVEDIVAEVEGFQRILRAERIRPAGIHLEATPHDVHECAEDGDEPRDPTRYLTLLDPRLNPAQTHRVLGAWSA